MAFRISALVLAPLFAVFALGVACEDQIVHFGGPDAGSPPSSNGGGIGQGGFTTSLTLVGGSTSISPTGGVAGGRSTSGFGGAGGGSVCAGGDAFVMEIDRYDGNIYGCSVALVDASPPSIKGTVLASNGISLTVDECPPDLIPCSLSQVTTVSWLARDLMTPMIPIGNYVEIEFDIALTQGGCTQRLQITDLPVWDTFQNPGGFDRTLWLAAADGRADPFVDAPFFVTPYALGGCGVDGISPYAFDFNLASDPGVMIEVFQGQLAKWQVDLPEDPLWAIRNLRSYQAGNPNTSTNWAYWVTPLITNAAPPSPTARPAD